MLRAEALRILGLKDKHTEEELRSAYVAAQKADHPDQGGSGTQTASLKKAKDFLMQRFATPADLPTCEPCKGRGVIKGLSKFGTTCKACQGTGRNTRR